ncbi:hypothetical protein SODALDRAFT_82694 [Sodiomyces alkalinus F11]|uniref:Uncharacterized protein n=1 Tax=Sodiomyces alkalinus (strain CBS 110278 / VKM F-3762 / F11) TaxID=1314773 RepID=A0A3N2PJI1_SODAK|nr:hypothetical protein SODALDRAFT_82694 [Sodiomyces alkalinus F11]ROT34675.1 hypothetical protein SODALDRAFT_82694 [Sodiomyces alkalinus F11]
MLLVFHYDSSAILDEFHFRTTEEVCEILNDLPHSFIIYHELHVSRHIPKFQITRIGPIRAMHVIPVIFARDKNGYIPRPGTGSEFPLGRRIAFVALQHGSGERQGSSPIPINPWSPRSKATTNDESKRHDECRREVNMTKENQKPAGLVTEGVVTRISIGRVEEWEHRKGGGRGVG